MPASWTGNTEKENEKVKEQKQENITVFELKTALTESQKQKPSRIEKVPNFWLNALSSWHVTLQVYGMKLHKTRNVNVRERNNILTCQKQ